MPAEIEQLTHAEAAQLAAELVRPGVAQSVFATLAQMEHRSRLAGRLIQALLRQTNRGDIFRLPPDGAP
jgi:hypothetical protein